jgi:hypothetical protein
MTTINTITELTPLLKRHYAKSYEDAVYRKNVTLMKIPKEYNVGGETGKYPIKFALGEGGGSADYASGSNGMSAMKSDAWIVTFSKDYFSTQVDGEAWMAASSNPDSFINVSKDAVTDGLQAMANASSIALFRNGSGVRGRANATALSTGTSLVLANPRDAKLFSVGMRIQASAAADGTGIKNSTRQITALDRSTGTLTFDTAFNTVDQWSANDYLYRHGDAGKTIVGFDAWLPEGTPSALFSVTRTQDREAFAGHFYDGSSQSISEGLIDGLASMIDLGAEPEAIIVSAKSYATLSKELGSQAFQKDFKKGEIGFQYLTINTPAGPVDIMGERNCPDQVAYCLNLKSWVLLSRGPKLFQLDERDGNFVRHNLTADALDFKFFGYNQLVCKAPFRNGRIKLQAV